MTPIQLQQMLRKKSQLDKILLDIYGNSCQKMERMMMQVVLSVSKLLK